MQAQPIPSSIPVGSPMYEASKEFQPFVHEGMYDFFARVRKDVPIFYAPEIGYWVVTRREDVLATLRDAERFSAVNATEPVVPWPQEMIQYLKDEGFTNESVQVACDAPRHTRIREHVQGFLNPKKIMSIEPKVREIVQGYIARLEGKDTVDLVQAVTYELPASTVFLLLGVDDVDPLRVKRWADLRVKLMHGYPTYEEQMAAAADLVDFWRFTCDIVEQRMVKPGDDYASHLLASRQGDDERITINEIKSLLFGLLLAGHETTANYSGNLIMTLLRQRENWEALVADPKLIPNAVEEGFRYISSVVAWRRRPKVDVEIGGMKLPAGSNIMLSLASAGRDEAEFENPEVFDIRRKNARNHVAFGNGVHFCMGAPLARMQVRMIVEELTRKYPDMTLIEDAQNPIEIAGVLTFRGPTSLPVRLHG